MGQHRCEPWRRTVPALVAAPPRSMQRAEHKQAGRQAVGATLFFFVFLIELFRSCHKVCGENRGENKVLSLE